MDNTENHLDGWLKCWIENEVVVNAEKIGNFQPIKNLKNFFCSLKLFSDSVQRERGWADGEYLFNWLCQIYWCNWFLVKVDQVRVDFRYLINMFDDWTRRYVKEKIINAINLRSRLTSLIWISMVEWDVK